MIEFNNVSATYDNGNVGLENVSLKIEDGEFVFLVGKSGAGKSTFIRLLLKEINADSGTITVNEKDVTKMSNRQIPRLRRDIGIVFQDFRLLENKTVFENVAFAMEIVHKPPRAIRRQVPQALEMVNIGDKAKAFPNMLSGGEQQRVAIARAIVNNPSVIICDEPTGNLDPETTWEIMRLLTAINSHGTTIVMVTHEDRIVDRMGKRVINIEDGHIVRDDVGRYRADEEARARAEVAYEESVRDKSGQENNPFSAPAPEIKESEPAKDKPFSSPAPVIKESEPAKDEPFSKPAPVTEDTVRIAFGSLTEKGVKQDD